jgi:release factor glutamine methyltransferase
LNTWSTIAGEKPGAVWLKRLSEISVPRLVTVYRRAVGMQAGGAPFQTAVGRAAFRTLELEVSRHTLIPRVETEGLVDQILAWSRSQSPESWGLAADIGTGTGAIALSLAVEGHYQHIIATDLSSEALEVARRNVDAVAPSMAIELRPGKGLEPLGGEKLNVLAANPPYLSSLECEQLPSEVRDFEPRMALDGGPDGLDPFRVLFADAAAVMVAGGLLALELDSRRAEPTLALAREAGWADARIEPDVFGRPRYLLATNVRGHA